MSKLSLELVKQVFPQLPPSVSTPIQGVSTDSRSLQPGEIFFAISGDRFDGHDFIQQAIDRGAAFCVSSKAKQRKADPKHCLTVNEPIDSLRELARAYRNTLEIEIIGVGGSNGKTTTKELCAFLLSQLLGNESVFKTAKSENSILGVALSLLRIKSERVAVIEIGIDEPGWMDRHLDLIQPDYGIITSISEEHLEKLNNIERVAQEELKLLQYIEQRGRGFACNRDCSWVSKQVVRVQHLGYSLKAKAEIEGKYLPPNRLSAFGMEWLNPLPGAHNALNLLASLCLLRLLRPDLQKSELKGLVKSLTSFSGEAHRSRLLRFEPNLLVFDDSYNANPASMAAALESFSEVSEGYEKIAVLGDMRELGDRSQEAHRALINRLSVGDLHKIFLIGPEMTKARSGLPKDSRIKVFDDIETLTNSLRQSITKNQSFLFKASRGLQLEVCLKVFENFKPKSSV
ncbi:MAG: UDP-N-acetylmuramoyl-tripeptide--D-alanyl-D-alanine ligase [Bradymonadales bacterium]|nr:MAG: UDP-N-acetylmuramoyl-tripeptide--D-alanyl-D-alanine ligase [Bradymonadales bacterium]